MTPERKGLMDAMRARAMSDEGLSDEEAAGFQEAQKALMAIAARDGGAAAIRAAGRPRPKPATKAKEKPKGREPIVKSMPADVPDPAWLREQTARKMAEEEALGERNYAAIAPRRAPIVKSMPADVPDPAWLQQQLAARMAEEEALGARNYDAVRPRLPEGSVAAMMREEGRGMAYPPIIPQGAIEYLMSLLSGGQNKTGWRGPQMEQNEPRGYGPMSTPPMP